MQNEQKVPATTPAPLISFDMAPNELYEALGISAARWDAIVMEIDDLVNKLNAQLDGWSLAEAMMVLCAIPQTAAEAFLVGATGVSFFRSQTDK